MRHKITIQSPAGSSDALGERTTVWSDMAKVFASVEPLRSTEIIAASQSQMEVTHRVILRYDSALASMTHGWRLLFGERVFVINGIINRDERDRQLELLCIEGLREE